MRYTGSAIIIFLVYAFMQYIRSSTKGCAGIYENNVLILKMNKVYGIIGYIGLFTAGLCGIIACILIGDTIQKLIFVLGMVLLFLLLSLPLVLASRNIRYVVTDESIKSYSLRGKSKEIKWSEVKDVKFGKTSLELSILSESQKIKLHMHLVGFDSFIGIMKEKIAPDIYKDTIDIFEGIDSV